MTAQGSVRRSVALVVMGVLVFLVAHVAAPFFGAFRTRLPVMIASGVIVIAVVVHLVLATSVRSARRQRARRRKTLQ